MTESSPIGEYQDETATLAVDLPGDGRIRVRAASDGVGAAVDLSIIGAQRLATMLNAGITRAIARGLGGGK